MDTNVLKYTSFLLILSSLYIVACTTTQQKQDLTKVTNFTNKVGWLHGKCLAIKNSNLSKGHQLKLVQLDNPQTTSSATILHKAKGGEECYPLLQDRRKVNMNSGYSFYSINSKSAIKFGIATTENISNFKTYVFDSCNTTEGIMFTMNKTNHKKDETLWSGYYYLGYESKPTCK